MFDKRVTDGPHFGFTGTQAELPTIQKLTLWNLLWEFYDSGFRTMHNGDCTGADYTAGVMWDQMDEGWIYLHPPIIQAKRAFLVCDASEPPKDYLVRNRDIVDASVELIACPQYMHEQQRSGTWSTVRYAAKKLLPINIVWPNGQAQLFNKESGYAFPQG